MRNTFFMCTHLFFCITMLSVIMQAQNSLTHNTGTLEVTIIDNGYIGDDATGAYGGVVFNGNPNAIFTAGIIVGANGAAWGNLGSFSIEDFFNFIPITGFYSNTYFNEITYHTITDIITDSKGIIASLSKNDQDFVFLRVGMYHNTSAFTAYLGIFADWDIGNSLLNRGGYDPSRNLFYMYENGGGNDTNYYGIVGINMDNNTIRGTIIGDFIWAREIAFGYMTSTTFDPITADGDYRMFISVGPLSAAPGDTVRADYAIVAGTSLADLQTNSDEARIYGQYVPVELTSFTAISRSGKVYLNWATVSETNNFGFEIERKLIFDSNEGEWLTIGFEDGYGTTTEPNEYSYVDDISNVNVTSLSYRLKQIDFDGSFEYSEEVLVANPALVDYTLSQNFPNPFNPVTAISYGVPVNTFLNLKVCNSLGEEVAVLVNEEKLTGNYEVEFNASNLSSGIYFYRLQAGDFVQTRKMILLK